MKNDTTKRRIFVWLATFVVVSFISFFGQIVKFIEVSAETIGFAATNVLAANEQPEVDNSWHTVQPVKDQTSDQNAPLINSSPKLPVQKQQSDQTFQLKNLFPKLFTDCNFEKPKKIEYAGRYLTVKKIPADQPGSNLEIKVTIQNMGNTPWFSVKSGCKNVPIVNLGTANTRDHQSLFFPGNPDQPGQNSALGWQAPNRVLMTTQRVDPGQVATFVFQTKPQEKSGYYREYFAPVVEGIAWLEKDALFYFDVNVGQVELTENQQKYFPYLEQSGNLSELNLDGEKKLEVSLKQQKMLVKVGDQVIRNFKVSTGKPSTPTPRGNFTVSLKQEVRIGNERPHYIMPKFQMIKANWGVGIHALPSLSNDRGVFWREALNHIGTPRSHGCIRLLPDDAEFAFNFTEIGTKVEVRL